MMFYLQVRLPRRQGAVGGVATSGVPILVSQGAEVAHLHPTPFTLHPPSSILHPTPCILYLAPYTLRPLSCTLNPRPLHPTPYTLHLKL